MTIQGMFDLISKVNNLNRFIDKVLSSDKDKCSQLLKERSEDSMKIQKYLPYFTPMRCKHCVNADKCNFRREIGVCNEYNVKL